MYKFDKKDVFSFSNADDAIQYMGQECYFEDSYAGLQYCIDNDIKGVLKHVEDDDDNHVDCIFVADHQIKVMNTMEIRSFGLCLPCKLVKKEEPKYRAFNGIDEFEKTLNIKVGDVVVFMDTTIKHTDLYTGNALGADGTQYITLGGFAYRFIDLLDSCRLIRNGEEVPFGVKD